MHGTERTRPEPTESEKKENKPKAAKILRAEKLDVSQQTKKNAEEKLDFLKQTKRTLQRKMKVEGPSFYMLCCFQFPEENFVHFTFHIFLPKMFSSALNTLSKFHIGPEKQF